LGKESSYLLGTLLVSKFQQIAMSRHQQAHSLRRDFWLYIDKVRLLHHAEHWGYDEEGIAYRQIPIAMRTRQTGQASALANPKKPLTNSSLPAPFRQYLQSESQWNGVFNHP
jgi:hypothetical protein